MRQKTEYYPETADICFHHNQVYNPRRVYAIKPSMEGFFTDSFIKSDDNTYYMTEDARIFNYIYTSWEKEDFNTWAHKEENSLFVSLSEINQDMVELACIADDISTIRDAFGNVLKQ